MSKLPTVCFLTGTLNAFSGAERMTAVVANALAERGYRVYVLSLWDQASVFPLHETVEHHALFEQRPSFKRVYFRTVVGIRKFCKRQRVDVLVQVDTMLSLFTLPATAGLGIEQIGWEHCHFDEDLGKPARRLARRLAARYCRHVVVLTNRDRQRWMEMLQPRGRIICIPNPLPFPFPATPAPRKNKTVLAMGRLVAAKGFDVLLHAWQRVAAEAPDWKLVICGEGEERNALTALVRQLGLQGSVSLPGICQDARQAYEQASVFCLSSRYEGFGLVLIEAMAFGLPIVSTDCETGPRELLRTGDNAVVVPVEDANALARGLLQAMQGGELPTAMASHGRQDASAYGLEKIIEDWGTLLARKSPSTSGSTDSGDM
ncbi:glycosyltransferase family 4 protein [Cupriavidus pinatubonensis]|uniref:glycosyltransferase family 4 protein n=1 Tax=Cupriavidus pinatubonensis TaxID=248026 RepID=UPI00112928AA|nr:glycosyltransferase family 4 protein [Cupriavidus pinatubonensis]TPQ39676.1 glycosyl transferase [Cupriavidus pinatubonensis]